MFREAIFVLIFYSLVKEDGAVCSFPPQWSSSQWMVRREESSGHFEVIEYNQTNSYTFATSSVTGIQETYSCDSFEEVQKHFYYIRSHPVGNDVIKTCIMDYYVNDVILHQEDNSATAVASLEACKVAINGADLYSVFVKIQITSDGFTVQSKYKYPFGQEAYRVSYKQNEDTDEICADETNSALSVYHDTISMLACKSDSIIKAGIPWSGTINCNSVLSPGDLGESGDSNGGVLILQWITKTTTNPFVYCARYKQIDKDIKISIDITSTSQLKCLRNSGYDWYGTKNGRQYVRLTLGYESRLLSPPTVMTTRRFTVTASGGSTTPVGSTKRPTLSPGEYIITHVQFKVNTSYQQAPTDRAAFKTQIQNTIISSSNTGIDLQQFGQSLTYNSSTDGKLVVTLDIRNLTSEQREKFRSFVNSNTFVIKSAGNTAFAALEDSFHNWKDTDNCSERTCANGGTCWVVQGAYSCHCPKPYTSQTNCRDPPATTSAAPATADGCPDLPCSNNGTCTEIQGTRQCVCPKPYRPPYCALEASTGISPRNLNIIIIVCSVVGVVFIILVVVFVVLRIRKSNKEEKEKSIDGYPNNNGTIDDRDREMYSTINKKPKAYHERSFVEGGDDGEGHGELTGIHM